MARTISLQPAERFNLAGTCLQRFIAASPVVRIVPPCCASASWPSSSRAPRSRLPAVRLPSTAAIAKTFPKSKVESCKAEKEHGHDQFEVRVTRADATKAEVDIAPDGTILQGIEEKIAVAYLSDAVKKAFAAKYPKAKAERAEKQTAGKDTSYGDRVRLQRGDVQGRRHVRRRGRRVAA